ncbi:MAG: beta-methylgalactoside transporter [Ruminococcaceae bacterium]|nr:beta-methylgalactoside transporter [Oscillospiraceae bacterium]
MEASTASKRFTSDKVREFFLTYALYIILGVMIVVVVCINPKFLYITNIMKILQQASTRGILALGVAGMIVLAGTDLSVGRIVGASAAVTASLVQSTSYASRMWPDLPQLPLIVPLLASIAVAMFFCCINGFGVAFLKLHAFIVSLGTQLIAYGVTCIYISSQAGGAQAISTFDQNFINLVNGGVQITGDVGIPAFNNITIPYLIFYFAIAAVAMWFVWNKTALGKNMFAIGGNTEAAAVSGVSVKKNIMGVYIVAGVLYGVASFLEAGRIQSVNTQTGLNYDLDAISGCVIGGVSFSGGVGTIPGVVIGVILLQVINYSLSFLGVNPYLQYIIKGLIIILAVSIDVRKYLAKK